jgi:signal peptidase
MYFGLTDIFTSLRPRVKAGVGSGIVLRRDENGRVVSIEFSGGQPVLRRSNASSTSAGRRMGESVKASKSRLGFLKAYIAVIVIAGVYVLSAYVLGTWTPIFAIPSNSMSPTINVGDLVLAKGVEPSSVNVGDIVVFNVPSPYDKIHPSPIIHRVVEKIDLNGTLYFKTKGDNNPSEDPWLLPAGNVVGVYAWRIPYMGYPILFLRSPYGLALVVVLALLPLVKPIIGRLGGGGCERKG